MANDTGRRPVKGLHSTKNSPVRECSKLLSKWHFLGTHTLIQPAGQPARPLTRWQQAQQMAGGRPHHFLPANAFDRITLASNWHRAGQQLCCLEWFREWLQFIGGYFWEDPRGSKRRCHTDDGITQHYTALHSITHRIGWMASKMIK